MSFPEMLYLVWSFEHDGWWRAGGQGYTRDLQEAARYRFEEAARIVADANIVTVNETLVPEDDAATFRAPSP